MRHHAHWQPKDRKEDMADDIRAWVQRTSDAAAQLPTLTRISTADLAALMLAVHRVDDEQTGNLKP